MSTLFLSFSRDTGRTGRTNERRPCCQDFFKKHPSPALPLPTSFVPLSFVSSQRDTRDGDWPTWLIVEIYRDSSSSSDCTLIGTEGGATWCVVIDKKSTSSFWSTMESDTRCNKILEKQISIREFPRFVNIFLSRLY